jgi:hypothetical protein
MAGFQALNLAMLVRPQLPEPCLCSSLGRASSSYGEGRRFEAVQRLDAFVAERYTRQLEVLVVRKGYAGSNPVERTMPL